MDHSGVDVQTCTRRDLDYIPILDGACSRTGKTSFKLQSLITFFIVTANLLESDPSCTDCRFFGCFFLIGDGDGRLHSIVCVDSVAS